MRRPQKSELTRSESCQSGPVSSRTTFFPARASTAAYTEPDAPAPTMTTSTFSFAMSPPLQRRDMRHVRNTERLVALLGAVDHVDRVAAKNEIGEAAGRALPALDPVLPHEVHQLALLRLRQLREAASVTRLACALDRAERRTIEIHVGRAHVEDARLEQRLLGRHRDLVVDEVRDAGGARARDQRLAERSDRLGFVALQHAVRHPVRARLAGRQPYRRAADAEGERAQPGAPDEIPPALHIASPARAKARANPSG